MHTRTLAVLAALVLAGTVAGARGGDPRGDPAPEITADAWLNSAPLTTAGLRGKVVLVEFWTFACWNCENVEPHVKRWHERYAGRGLTIVAVHTPELRHERDPARVKRYVEEHGIEYPVAIDNGYATWRRFGNRYWPAFYLIDRQGVIRHVRFGEGGYAEMQARIEKLLAEPGPAAPPPAEAAP